MYQFVPWSWLKVLGSWGVATTAQGKAGMRSFIESYAKEEYVELAAHGYKMLACPALLLCGEKDHAGDVKVFNRKWAAGEKIPLVWIPGAGHNSNVDNPSFVNSKIEQLMVALK